MRRKERGSVPDGQEGHVYNLIVFFTITYDNCQPKEDLQIMTTHKRRINSLNQTYNYLITHLDLTVKGSALLHHLPGSRGIQTNKLNKVCPQQVLSTTSPAPCVTKSLEIFLHCFNGDPVFEWNLLDVNLSRLLEDPQVGIVWASRAVHPEKNCQDSGKGLSYYEMKGLDKARVIHG